jgi:hypothetical protein
VIVAATSAARCLSASVSAMMVSLCPILISKRPSVPPVPCGRLVPSSQPSRRPWQSGIASSCPWVGCTASSPGRSLPAAPRAIRWKSAEIIRLKEACVKPSEIARKLGIGRASVYRVLMEP